METGTIINQYKIISAVGKGGMGEVYQAQDSKLGRQVALKILPSEFAEDKARMSRFVQEAQAAAALNHPHIAHVYEIGQADNIHYIAMEFVDGITLRCDAQNKTDLKRLLKYQAIRRRFGKGTCRGYRPSRPEAGKHHGLARWIRKDTRFWAGQAC
ncbi:MAG: protein kinase [Acidobacteria bacterium]|nr:protein kinase [Acidobacteriota bacterium]